MSTKKAATTAKTATVKKTKEPELFNTLTMLLPNWKHIPSGTKVKGSINSKNFDGRIQRRDSMLYLCQNVVKEHTSLSNKLGFKFAYGIGNGTLAELNRFSVIITEITLDPGYFVPIDIKEIAGHKVKIKEGFVEIGCNTVDNDVIRELAKNLKD